jgi:hypothetical protein
MATGCHRRAERGGIQSASGSALTGGHFMKFKLPSILVGAALGVLALTRPAAHAAPASSVFDQDYCSTSCLNGALGGTVTLSQTDADNVLVTVDLTGVYFHSTKDSFAFDLDLTGATKTELAISTTRLIAANAVPPTTILKVSRRFPSRSLTAAAYR